MTTDSGRNGPPSNSAPNTSTSPSMKLIMIFAITVIFSLSFQKALPVLDIALSCHAKTLCSATFLSYRLPSDVDIGEVRSLSCLFHWLILLGIPIEGLAGSFG